MAFLIYFQYLNIYIFKYISLSWCSECLVIVQIEKQIIIFIKNSINWILKKKIQKIYSLHKIFRIASNRRSDTTRKGSVYFSCMQKDNKPNKLCSRRPRSNKGRNRDFRKFVLIVSIRSGTNKTFLRRDFPGNFSYTRSSTFQNSLCIGNIRRRTSK